MTGVSSGQWSKLKVSRCHAKIPDMSLPEQDEEGVNDKAWCGSSRHLYLSKKVYTICFLEEPRSS